MYSFEYKEAGSIYFTLLIDGKARAFYELNIDNAIPEYDFDNPIWRWNSDHTTATLFFEDKHGGEQLAVEAEISRVQDILHVTYTATAIYGSETYRDTYEYDLEAEYDFDNPIWDWNSDYTKATLSFEEIHGAEPIVVEAEINDEYIAPECESAGKTIYYATAMYNDIEYKSEQELIVEATGHDYGNPEYDWIGNDDGYTVVATFHCANDSQHTEIIEAEVNKEEEGNHVTYTATVEFEGKTYTDTYEYDIVSGSSAQLSLRDGQVFINTRGYSNQESGLSNPTEFVSSSTNPYLIQDEEIDWCDNIINVYQTDENILTADIYIKLKDVTIEAGSWCSLFRIVARNTLNVHLIIEGNVTFVGGQGQQIFSSQGNYSPTVNIIIDQTSLGGTFNAEITSGLTYAQTGTISVNYV